ncbi:DUF2946 family protein [Ruegeria meonggei]|uniref:DUF2946 domain-containing protein n=1 Tax=Ruegeria meonggei TaxID=1446476 RepID=A0A1X6ZMY1_9RHOB|nr:DUF2946 family protein [Ruegeria meonggei]SLN56456.1 hypothetical protein RUM8411_02750 [Ruegeria meonggei]
MTLSLRLLTLLTVLALLLTGAIPQGWMPTMGDDGKVLLVLCTGEGTVEQWVDLDPDDPIHDNTDERAMCPFAGLTADVDFPSVGAITPFTATIQPRWTHLEFTHRSAGFHARYDARAPPLFS